MFKHLIAGCVLLLTSIVPANAHVQDFYESSTRLNTYAYVATSKVYWETAVQVEIGNLPVGTLVDVNGRVQVSNKSLRSRGKALVYCVYLMYDPHPGDTFNGPAIQYVGGQNISAARHHDTTNFSHTFIVTEEMKWDRYLKIVVVAASTAAITGDYMTIDFASIQAKVYE